jgi:hypothetical protein
VKSSRFPAGVTAPGYSCIPRFDLDRSGAFLHTPRPMKTRSSPILILLAFICLAAAAPTPKAFGILPTPDGCYPNYTTAEGCNALNFLTTGAGNTGVGWYSLYVNSTGSFNTGVGGGALALNNGDSNTATGAAALLLNTSGTENTAVGTDALVFNDSGSYNSAVGTFALFSNTAGVNNIAVGTEALSENTDAHDNTAVGFQSLASNQGGINAASWNTATGSQALYSNTIGQYNCAFGAQALFNNTNGDRNCAFGYRALQSNHAFTGAENNAFGASALGSNVSGQQNSAFGDAALINNLTGDRNTAIGASAGINIDGDGNVCVGAFVLGEAGVSDSTYIRNVNTLAQPIVSGIDGVTVRLSDGRLGHGVSSRRYKEDIKPMNKASEALYRLQPVVYRYKKEIDPTQSPAFGLIAEDVASVNPELVACKADGQPEAVHYEMINAMLLNEFLKEHRKVQAQQSKIDAQDRRIGKQEATIAALKNELQTVKAEQQRDIQTLTARLEQQAAQIQSVQRLDTARRLQSAQIEMSKFALGRIRRGGTVPQIVVNNP